MGQQICLPFIKPLPPRPRHAERVFTAVKPDAAAIRRIDALRWRLVDDLGLEGAQIPASRLHVSLHHIRDATLLRSGDVFVVERAAAEIALAPLEVVLDSVETFRGPPGKEARRPTVLRGGSDELTALHEALGAAIRRQGRRVAGHFKAHITLCYGHKVVARQRIEPIRFKVDNFVLIHSERGLGRHNVLRRWPLIGVTQA